jgi:hypothetical protein
VRSIMNNEIKSPNTIKTRMERYPGRHTQGLSGINTWTNPKQKDTIHFQTIENTQRIYPT